MENNLLANITGSIRVNIASDDNGASQITASWEGGDIVGISEEFLEYADPKFIQREGDLITICQFHLRLIGGDGRTYLAQRIE